MAVLRSCAGARQVKWHPLGPSTARERAPARRNAFYKGATLINYDRLFIIIVITTNHLILCLFLSIFYPFATPLTTSTASFRKRWFTFIFCTTQWCSSTAPVSKHCRINSNNVREMQGKKIRADRYFWMMYSQ